MTYIVEYDTIIISDVHLGSDIANAKQLLQFLKHTKFNRLIILGDMFADLNFSRLNSDHWKVLSYLRELSNPKRNIEIVWVIGNHDLDLQNVMSHLVGIEVLDKYEWTIYDKKCVAMHGHQFDPAMGMPAVTKAISWWFLKIQKIPGFQKTWCRWIDKVTGHFQNLSKTVELRSLKYATMNKYDVICCGHTHEAMYSSQNGTEYYNSGCWVKNENTYIAFYSNQIQIIRDTH